MMGFMKKKINESLLYCITSKDTENDEHFLFLEWDIKDGEEVISKGLAGLELEGILIRSVRGYHFISNHKVKDLETLLAVEKLLGADYKWITENRKRGFAALRISIKYEDEPPLQVIDYPLTDTKLKQWYEKLIERFFYKGQPYQVDSDGL